MKSSSESAHSHARTYFWPLLAMLFLFCLRVLGQLIVALWHVPWLPPMEEWFSGLIPYPPLLFCQILIIGLYGKVCFDLAVGSGYFAQPHPKLGKFLCNFGVVYLAVMVLRYIIRMSLFPMERWTGGCIPIFFHWDLAFFLLVLAKYQLSVTQEKQIQ